MFESYAKKIVYVTSCRGILGSEGNSSNLAAHFSRSSGTVNTVLFTIEMFWC